MAKSPDNGRPARPDVLITKQVAEEWGGSEQHVRNMVNRGQLGHFQLGGKLLRIPRTAVDEAERAMMAEPRPTPAKKR